MYFKIHIKLLENKLSRSVGISHKTKSFYQTYILRKLCYAFIHTQLNFGLLIWSATPKSNLTKVIRIQNKAIRLLAGADWKTHAPSLYSKLNILSLNKLTTHVIAKFMRKHYLGKLPKNFNDYFTLVSSVHFCTTRNSLKLYQYFIPQFPTNKLQRGIKYKGSKIWNSVPEELKKLNHTQFKRKHKTYLLSNE